MYIRLVEVLNSCPLTFQITVTNEDEMTSSTWGNQYSASAKFLLNCIANCLFEDVSYWMWVCYFTWVESQAGGFSQLEALQLLLDVSPDSHTNSIGARAGNWVEPSVFGHPVVHLHPMGFEHSAVRSKWCFEVNGIETNLVKHIHSSMVSEKYLSNFQVTLFTGNQQWRPSILEENITQWWCFICYKYNRTMATNHFGRHLYTLHAELLGMQFI